MMVHSLTIQRQSVRAEVNRSFVEVSGMKNWALRVLRWLSLAVFIVTTALWVRSYWRLDRLVFDKRELDASGVADSLWLFSSDRGALTFVFEHNTYHDDPGYVKHPLQMRYSIMSSGSEGYNGIPTADSVALTPWAHPADMRMGRGIAFGSFGAGTYRDRNPSHRQWASKEQHIVRVPHLVVMLLTGVLPALWLRRRRLERRRTYRLEHRLCVHCGYDLRASTGYCPECGEPSAPPPPSVPGAIA